MDYKERRALSQYQVKLRILVTNNQLCLLLSNIKATVELKKTPAKLLCGYFGNVQITEALI